MNKKIDKRKKYFLVVDVETANDVDEPLVYDIGYAITDKKGYIYEKQSFLIYDIFVLEKILMQSAYYKEKVPQYNIDLKAKKHKLVSLSTAQKNIKEKMREYRIKEVFAYNCYFDKNALNNTLRYTTKSKLRWFFPFGTKFRCIWNMSCQVLYTQTNFIKFAIQNNYISESGNIKTSAEIGYRYLTGLINFEEAHTGLKDVEIECQLLARCFAQHKKMDKKINRMCWRIPTKKKKELKEKEII